MTSSDRSPWHVPAVLALFAITAVLVLSCGCTQQTAKTTDTTSGVSITKPDDTHISVAFVGAPGMDGLLELEITVTDSNGKNRTQSIGSRLHTTPIQVHSTQTFTGSYGGRNYVFITAYFTDGSQRTIIDQDI
ncbi:MAG: hypothetical protein ABSG49_04510 [Methanoregula sp.]|jgi:hypothetical protein|uniref:hypothetical protein n=1 Tax=Methanoregula sp. TaxID=2052170 RepID=UPI003C288A3A